MNAYILNTETMQWPIYEGDFVLMFPNTSFPSPLVNLPAPYVWVQITDQPTYNWLIQGVKEITPVETDGVWYQAWEIYTLSPEQIAANEEAVKQGNKSRAEQLLKETDWVEVPSVSDTTRIPHLANFEEFMTYRLALRAIAVTPPVVVTEWPTLPQENWVTE